MFKELILNQIFLKHINKYHPIQWLFKSVQLSRRDNSKIQNQLDTSSSPEFLVIMSDIAIRVSQNNKLYYNIPTDKEYQDFISLYINTQSNTHPQLLEEYGGLALSLIVTEQVKFQHSSINLLGRLSLLYSEYEDEIFKITELKITHIITIVIALMAFYKKSENYIFEVKHLYIENIEGLKKENIIKFLNYFAKDVKFYKTELKNLGFDKRQLYSFRLLEKVPIIKFNTEHYIVPSLDNLLYSVTSNMNIHLLTYFFKINKDTSRKTSKKYHNSLGAKFEDYVRLLTSEVFDNIVEAKELVPKETKNAEFVIDFDNTAIVVEVKKFVLLRDSAFKTNIDDLDMLLERHIVKAYEQIETTFKYIKEEKNKIGIIVTLGDIHMQTFLIDHIRSKYPSECVEYLDNIIIMSIGEYESLLANKPEDIITILNTYLNTNPTEKGDVLLVIKSLKKKTINPFLMKRYSMEISKINL